MAIRRKATVSRCLFFYYSPGPRCAFSLRQLTAARAARNGEGALEGGAITFPHKRYLSGGRHPSRGDRSMLLDSNLSSKLIVEVALSMHRKQLSNQVGYLVISVVARI